MNEYDVQLGILINKMFTKLENPNEPLTEWEETFVDSVKSQWEKAGRLSVKQREILERIYTEKTP